MELTTIVKGIFWILIILLAYTWMLYPFLLMALNLFNKLLITNNVSNLPFVTVILTVYNEEKIIETRLSNLLELDYPINLFQIIVASDGSNDGTNNTVSNYVNSNLILYAQSERRGKSRTQNAAVSMARGDIIVFTDADALFNPDFVRKIVRSFADPRVGCVTGECTYQQQKENITTESLGFFWRYELLLRRLESNAGMLFTGSGACMAVRRKLFKPLDAEYGEDCIVPLDVLLQGYLAVAAHEARALVLNVPSPRAEYRARLRMTLRNFTGTMSRSALVNPLKFPKISLAIFSHKFLRWFTPFFLMALFIFNLKLLDNVYYVTFLSCQLVFYCLALLGILQEGYFTKYKVISWPFSFCLANLGIMIGALKALFGKKIIKYTNR